MPRPLRTGGQCGVFLCVLLVPLLSGALTYASDATVLLDFAALSNFTLSGWYPNNTAYICVDWERVVCRDGRVVELLLETASGVPSLLRGKLPSSVRLLDKLETLSLDNNEIYGELPEEILSSATLRAISIESTGISVRLPATLGPYIHEMRMAHALLVDQKLPETNYSSLINFFFDGATVGCPLPQGLVTFLNSGGSIPNCRMHFTFLTIDDDNNVCGQVHISRFPCSLSPSPYLPPFLAEDAIVPSNYSASFGKFNLEFFNDEVSIFATYTDRTGARRSYRREYVSFKMQSIGESYGPPGFPYQRTYSKPKWQSFTLRNNSVLANMTNTDGFIHEYRFEYRTDRPDPYLKMSGAVYNINHTWIEGPFYDSSRRVTVNFAFAFRLAHSPVDGIPITCGAPSFLRSRCTSNASEITSDLDFFTGEYVVQAKTRTVDMKYRFLPTGELDGVPITVSNSRLFVNRNPFPFADGTWLQKAGTGGYEPNATITPEVAQGLSLPASISIPHFRGVFSFDPDTSITLLFNPNENLPPDTATPMELQIQSTLNVAAVVVAVVVSAVVVIGGATVFAFVVFPYMKARQQAAEAKQASLDEELEEAPDPAPASRWTSKRPTSSVATNS